MKTFIKLVLRFLPKAFDATNMNRVHTGTVTVWAYKSSDTIAAIVASGYFDNYVDWLRQGDIILASQAGTGMTTVSVTSANGATPVTVAKTS